MPKDTPEPSFMADFIEHGYSGEKAPEKPSSAYPLFKEAGLRGIFYLLQSPERVNQSFRARSAELNTAKLLNSV